MSGWSFAARARARLVREALLFAKKRDAEVRVCLAYPNHYAVALGNLGFQAVYEIIDREPGVVCERAFFPEDGEGGGSRGLCTLESRRPVAEAAILAFSLSFESDSWRVLRMLALAGLPLRSAERGDSAPLVIAGGPAVFLNPEPLADFVDVFLIGEAEEMLPEFFAVYRECRAARVVREDLLVSVAERVAGAYVPRFFRPVFAGPVQSDLVHEGPGPARVRRRLVWDLDRYDTSSRVLAPEAVFGDMVLVEASRGCQWGCRFCAAGYMYRPVRTRSAEKLAARVRAALAQRTTVGLVGAEIASVPGVEQVVEMAADAGGRVSPSSLKADCVTPRLAAALARGGNRTVTIAPEAGSERMRRVINKNLTESEILRAAELLAGEGARELKLYFMIGLPCETEGDVDAIAELTARIAERARTERGSVRVTVSVNPFVPKPWTAFQWDAMADVASLRAKTARLRAGLRRVRQARLAVESAREAYFQALLSRGDRRVGTFLARIEAAGGNWWNVLQQWRRGGLEDLPHPDAYVHREYGEGELLPWDFIDHRIEKKFLLAERRKARAGLQTPPCDTATCTACAAC